VQDAGDMAVRAVGGAFSLGVQLAAPVIAFSLILNIAAGLVGRLMPQFQIFFVAAPLNILIGLSILALSLGVIGLVWIDRYEAYTRQFLGGAGG
jgi:flagellar biosynthetic protein FliR